MARSVEPLDPSNPDLDVATAVMGNRTKSLIVRHLWQNGPSQGTEIVKATGLVGATMSLAMQQLEQWGVVTGSIPSNMRHGRPVVYTLNQARVRELMRLWFQFISGDPDSRSPS
jgi:hypothetical protein